MGKTANLQLNTFPSSEWGTKKYGDFIKELAGPDAASNMQIIDNAVGALRSNIDGKADLVDGLVPISQLPSQVKEIRIVGTIAERDAITDIFANLSVYVKDASSDPTVASGGASYLYDGSGWIKTGEAESMDVVQNWANIQDKPALVNTFHGRSGAVSPQSGDYTAAMVGAATPAEVSSSLSAHNTATDAHAALFEAIDAQLGDISSLLDSINGEVV